MENEENQGVITVENEGGKGNPNHAPAGAPGGKGGQFVSGPQSGGKDDSDDVGLVHSGFEPTTPLEKALFNFVSQKKEMFDKQAQAYISSVADKIPEETRNYFASLNHGEKLDLLYKSPLGFDKSRLGFATEAQLDALLYAEAVKNYPQQLEQQRLLLEKRKTEINDEITEKLNQYNIDSFSGMWVDTVRASDYKFLKEAGKFDKKKAYYEEILAKEDAPLQEKVKATQFIARLGELEKAGLAYEEAKSNINLGYIDELENIETKINEISNSKANYDQNILAESNTYIERFLDKNAVYSQSRKNNATWINQKWLKEHPEYDGLPVYQASIKHFGDRFEKMWQSMTAAERNQLIDYTGGGYSKYNKPLRGLSHGGWSGFKFADAVTTLTNAIDKCVWDEDIWVQRGISDVSTLFKAEGKSQPQSLGSMTEKELQSLVGTTITEKGFYSAGAGKGTGFTGEITLNTYCPKGTKMAYMNTKGHYSHGSENEMILQRGYSFRITKVEKGQYGHFYIDCEVILGSDANNITDKEELAKIGNKHLY